eukprot:CAMPEP_0195144444 /NCGR_PEP_ID=MMETSP0448-20130528/168076_1 /TAXON_ID=66468 /ORGANISM="Heterocapsa triquestra, Strain CCMP 448" /LENGTH=69 /DNA_ID=CAMNT_0040182917 /DNA_START=30 /DNA_END=236 /DNA_ORIENTATION=-
MTESMPTPITGAGMLAACAENGTATMTDAADAASTGDAPAWRLTTSCTWPCEAGTNAGPARKSTAAASA